MMIQVSATPPPPTRRPGSVRPPTDSITQRELLELRQLLDLY